MRLLRRLAPAVDLVDRGMQPGDVVLDRLRIAGLTVEKPKVAAPFVAEMGDEMGYDVGSAPKAVYDAYMEGIDGIPHAFLRYLEPLREERPDFRAEQLALLVARALAGLSRHDEARQAFERAVGVRRARGLDGGETEGLHAVSGDRQVLPLRGGERRLHVDTLGHIRRHEFHELHLRGVETVPFDASKVAPELVSQAAVDELLKRGVVRPGDWVVLTKGDRENTTGGTNIMKLLHVGDKLL